MRATIAGHRNRRRARSKHEARQGQSFVVQISYIVNAYSLLKQDIPTNVLITSKATMVIKLKQPNTSSAGPAPTIDTPAIVRGVIDDIRANGDAAVRKYSEKFDKWSPASFKLSPEEIKKIIASVPTQIIDDIKQVQDNVRTFARAQKDSIKEFELEIRPGVHLGQKNVPINSVGA